MLNPIAFRLGPGQDLKRELDAIAVGNDLCAAYVITCVGSLKKAVLRYANQEHGTELEGFFEIVSLTGTFSTHGSHYHIAISDGRGQTVGGHLLEGCRIYTTAEVVIGVLDDVEFLRTFDQNTGFPELEIQPLQLRKGE
jgi:uncharacterized protein